MKEGFMEIVTNIDSKMQKEFYSNLLWLGVINLVMGAVLFFITVLTSRYLGNENNYIYFIVGLCVFFGAFVIALYFINIKNTRYKNRSVSCKFYLDYVEYSMLYHGEVEASRKLFYQDIYKVRETKNYIFIYIDLANFVPVLKSIVPDLPTLRELINKK